MNVRDLYERQVRGLSPEHPPSGAVVERDGPLVRVHYGTHGTVDHATFDHDDLPGLIRRQQEVFAARCEPAEWKVHSTDPPRLAEHLRAAGFTPGPERVLLAAGVEAVRPSTSLRDGTTIGSLSRWDPLPRGVPEAVPDQRRALRELLADGLPDEESDMRIFTLEWNAHVLGLLWIERLVGTDFAAVGGITGDGARLLHQAARVWAPPPDDGRLRAPRRHTLFLVAEAAGPLVGSYTEAGFAEIGRVTTYRWAPPGEPARDRPVEHPVRGRDDVEVLLRFEERFGVTYETAEKGMAEPAASATWHLGDADAPTIARVEEIVERGLRACARPGDRLYRLKWYITSTRIDPLRVGGPGQPPWTCYPYLDDEHVILVTADLRMGTFGNWRESSLCVFGDDLVGHVDEELTALLGTVLRRGGRPVGNVWSFGPQADSRTIRRVGTVTDST
uniref:DUF2716 domain-containing protein n=1 Tax=Herbidospora sakaeratensis TaxID=564415 RepID=UPI0009FECC8B|nr:DUF2716 domain-containing protein [Herbidospora sakaeratensis]